MKYKLDELLKEARQLQRRIAEAVPGEQIDGPNKVAEMLAPYAAEPQEVLGVVVLNSRNIILGIEIVHKGGTASAEIHIPSILRTVLKHPTATSFIIFHNHPSGRAFPSQDDRGMTSAVAIGAKAVDLTLLDHIIIAAEGYYSFQEEGILPQVDQRKLLQSIYY